MIPMTLRKLARLFRNHRKNRPVRMPHHRLPLRFERLEDRAVPAALVGLDTANNLVAFDSATPGTTTTTPVTGLGATEILRGIDYRPADGKLYGLAVDIANTGRLYTINTTTGAATLAVTLVADPADATNPYTNLNGTFFGVDFNPVADRMRIVSNTDQNLAVDVTSGLVTTDTNLNPAGANIVGIAYTNNFAGAAVTTLFGIGSATDALNTISPPASGTLVTVGPLGVDTNENVGFDISGANTFASLTVGGKTGLYTIDLAVGTATLVGDVGSVILSDVAIVLDVTAPTVTINQAPTQTDPANAQPVHFTVTFSEPVTGFDSTDILVGGTAGATTATVTTTDNITFDVAVSGATTAGTVTIGFVAGAAQDAAGNPSLVPSITDNTVTLTANVPPDITAPASASTNEDTALTLTGGLTISVADPDAGTGALAVTVAAPNGTVTLASTTGLTFTTGANGDSTFTFTGTLTDINAALNGATFTPAADFNGATTLQVTANDQGNTGIGGPQSDTATVDITVNAVNDAPAITAPTTVTPTENTVFAFTGADLISIADVDNNGAAEEVTLTITNGTISLGTTTGLTFSQGTGAGDTTAKFTGTLTAINTALATLTYNPSTNFSGAASLTVHVDDLGNTGSGGAKTADATVALSVSGVNDAPAITAPTTAAVTEDTAITFTGALAISIADPDAGAGALKVTVNAPNGTVTLASTTGLTFTSGANGDSSFVVTGTLTDINTALNGATFTPALSFSGATTLAIDVDDQGNTGTGGAKTDSETIAITVDAVNDAPTITLPAGGTVATPAGTPLTFSGSSAITIADVDSNGAAEEVTLTITNGTLTFGSTTGLTFSQGTGTGDTTAKFQGTLTDINAALLTLTFTPTAAFTGTADLAIHVDDLGNTGSGGAKTADATLAIVVAGTNQAPTITAPATAAVNEDTALPFTGSLAITIADPDAGTGLLEVTLTAANGSVTLASTTGLTFTSGANGDSTFAFTGTLTNINAALNGATFTPALNFNGATTLVIDVDDQGNTGSGGPQSDSETIAITVNPVNDAPTITAPATATTPVNTALAFTGANLISIADVDAGGNPEEVTLTVTNGTISLGTTTGLTFSTGDGTGDTTMKFQGTLADINAALATLTYSPTTSFSGAADLAIHVDDLGNTGSGGPLTDDATVAITVTAANAAPVITAPATATTAEDTVLAFTGANVISIADADAGSNPEEVTLTITNGTITLGTTTGLTFSTGDGTGDTTMKFQGTLTDINAALATLTYTPTADFSGAADLTIHVDDLGNTGTGGPLTDDATVAITVTGANDAPVITAPATATTDEDTNLAFTGANLISIADADAGSNPEEVTLTVTNGTITLGTTTGLTFSTGDGTGDTTMKFQGTVTDINAALATLTYSPTANFNGAASLAIHVDDLGNTGGAAQTDDATVAITVTAVNDGPTITAPATVTANEDTALVFSGANLISIADVDAGTGSLQVVLAVTNGTITLSGTTGLTFTAGDGTGDKSMTFTGSLTNINAALSGSKYTPNASFSGSDTLTINVDDQGNTGTGGSKTASASTAITITSVNDAPVAVNDSFTTKQNTPLTISAPGILQNDTDADGTMLNAFVVTSINPAAGTLDFVGNGAFTFTPAPNFVGTASFTYRASDGLLGSNTATVTITVTEQFTRLHAVGAGAGGGPQVIVYNDDGSVRFSFYAFDPSYTGGVSVATGDVNADGVEDIIVGAGHGGGPHVRVLSGVDLGQIHSFYAFDSIYTCGTNVATGDVNGDGRSDIIVGAGLLGGPHVRVFDAVTGQIIQEFFAYDAAFHGGVNVASGDLDGDGRADIVAGAGPGGGPHVIIYKGLTSQIMQSYYAFDQAFTGGVDVAVGEFNNKASVFAAAGDGGVPVVQVFDFNTATAVASFMAFDGEFDGGVQIATEVLFDGTTTIFLGAGRNDEPRFRAILANNFDQKENFLAFDPAFLGGVFVG